MRWRTGVMVVACVAIGAGADLGSAARGQGLPIEETPVIAPPSEERPLKEARLDTERFELGPYAGIYAPDGFGASAVFGLRLSYHVNEDIAFEGSYAISQVDQTAFRRLTGRSLLVSDDLWYWNVGVSYDLFPGQIFLTRKRTINSAIYVVGGLGQVNMDERSHFSMNIGTGFKLFVTDWFNIRPDFRLHVFETDVTGEKTVTYNLEGTLALALFF
ncbi:MAG: outer membrane beta-barrel domain-containing protein [Nitrospirota bacterium]